MIERIGVATSIESTVCSSAVSGGTDRGGPMGCPEVSAKAWAIFDANAHVLLWGRQEVESQEIASLTKIMTAYTAIKVMARLDVNMMTAKIEVSSDAAGLPGTSANLQEGDALSVWDMLHAMLLPSGNDAAYAIAEYFGLLLTSLGLPPLVRSTRFVDIFVAEMNSNAKLLKMENTRYNNPHGLQDPLNQSCAADLARLAAVCMGMPLFAEIVKKHKYSCLVKDENDKYRQCNWYNTNKLLVKGFNGVKTGITPSAGPCLASSYRADGLNLIIVVLGCKTPDHRWHEVVRLKNFAVQALSPAKCSPRCKPRPSPTHTTRHKQKAAVSESPTTRRPIGLQADSELGFRVRAHRAANSIILPPLPNKCRAVPRRSEGKPPAKSLTLKMRERDLH